MYTLQILDRGQTFFHPLDGRPVVVGSDPDVDLRLGEADVLGQHARIETVGDRLHIVALAKLLVNGRATQQAELALGDRIEIGRAVLVVGRAVARAAKPEDVLEPSLRRSGRVPKRRNSKLLPLLAAGGLLAVVCAVVLLSDSGAGKVQAELAMVRRALEVGDTDRVRASLERLRREWAETTDGRLGQLELEQQQLDTIETATAQLTASVLDPSIERTYSQWNLELQRLEREGAPVDRIAARAVRSSLHETLLRRPKPAAAPDPARGATPVAKGTDAGALAAAPGTAPATAVASAPVDVLAEVRRVVQQGLFAQALAMVEAELGDATDPAVVARLQTEQGSVLAASRLAMANLVTEAKRSCEQGQPRDAVTALATAQHRFPRTEEFRAMAQALRDAEAAVVAAEVKVPRERSPVAGNGSPVAVAPASKIVVDEGARRTTLATLRTQLDRIRDAEERAAFGDAVALLREGAAMVKDRDADFAARLETRAAEAELLAAWHEWVATRLRAGQKLLVALRSGRTATLTAVDGATLVGNSGDGSVRLSWHDIAPAGVQALADQTHAEAGAALGAATLLYKSGETGMAEATLAKLLRGDAQQKPAVDRVIARGRGEPFDARGYSLGKEGFVSAVSVDTQKQAVKFASRLDTALRSKDLALREAFLNEVLAQGPEALAALVAAFQKEFAQQLAKLDSSPLRKQVDKLAAQRADLDRARQFAKDLIYDEVTYFYPYKPPAVSSERFAEYNRVQAEVDRRVAAVRTIWHDDRLSIKIPASLQGDLDRLDWVAKVLSDMGELDASRLAQVDWARALPPGDSIGIADFCQSSSERAELEQWRHVEAYNTILQKEISAPAREQLKVTNDYRAMFRHRPLALGLVISKASQGHAEEMSRLGYFAHMSPTPGRRTPFDRMRLAGYENGVSENIALNDSAPGAHNAWCHSSGHHRNLLSPHHKEFGIGVDGRNWVQNFGSGSTYEQQPAWNESPAKGRAGRR